MIRKVSMFILVCALTGVFCLDTTRDAQAQGKLREWLQNKRMERKNEGGGTTTEGDVAGLMDDSRKSASSCADRIQQVTRILNGPMGKKAQGPAADLQDVAYGPHKLQTMDIFYSKAPDTSALAPVIMMVHGGGWCVGDKKMKGITTNKIDRWTPKGFLFISVNYPMVADGSIATDQAADIARAIAYVQKHAQEWGGDPERIITMGHSAGAHLVSLVNADADIRNKIGVKPVLGTISLDSGATNVPVQMTNPDAVKSLKVRYLEAFGPDEAGWIAASPHHNLDDTASPWLGVCSSTRPDDPCGQAQAYAKKSRELGVNASALPVPKKHGSINSELGTPGEYTDQVEKFMMSLDPVVKDLLTP